MRSKKSVEKSQRGIALFMVMGAVALLTVLVAELTYSTQIGSRMAYNYVDNLKAYYLAKAAFKLSEVRLRAYLHVKAFTDDPANKGVKDSLPKGTLDKIWSMPLIFPLPIPKEASMAEGDAVKDFIKASSLDGTYTANITGESSKLNINNLFVHTLPAEGPSGASGTSGSSGAKPPPATTGASGASGSSGTSVDFRPLLAQTISSLIEQKKNEDREFADVFRNLQGEDVVTAIEYYLFPDKPLSNLPGFKQIKPKLAPLYSLTELHLIPGIEDELYKLLEGALTVYTTPGINMNMIGKNTLRALFPEMTEPEADDVLRNRDDPDIGKPWGTEEEFWQDVGKTSVGKNLETAKKNMAKAGIKFLADELSFKISILANVGQSTRRLEAHVVLDPKGAKAAQAPAAPQGTPPGVNVAGQPPQGQQKKDGQQNAPDKKATGINLIYWRML